MNLESQYSMELHTVYKYPLLRIVENQGGESAPSSQISQSWEMGVWRSIDTHLNTGVNRHIYRYICRMFENFCACGAKQYICRTVYMANGKSGPAVRTFLYKSLNKPQNFRACGAKRYICRTVYMANEKFKPQKQKQYICRTVYMTSDPCIL